MKYIRFYKVQNFPYVAILHPATGAAIWSREMVSASLLFEKIQDFIGQYPSPDLYGQERRGLEPEEKFADKVMTSSISLPMPLSSFSFIPSQILLKENSNPRPFREIRGGMRLKIKMPNGHVFLRIFSADDCLMVLVLEIIDQISQQDHSKPFDILYDHPQKSLSARAFLGSSELINDFLNSTSFRAVGITFDQVVLVRFSDD